VAHDSTNRRVDVELCVHPEVDDLGERSAELRRALRRRPDVHMLRADGDASTVEVHHVQRADEVCDELGGRLLVHLARRAELLDAAAVHDGDPVAHREGLVLVVRHVHEGRPELVLDALELELHLLAQLHVERAERFVEQERGRPVDERARERDALLLTARELPWPPALVALERHDAEDLGHPLPVVRARDAPHLQPERDVVVDRHVREEGVLLEDHVHRAAVGRGRRHVASLEDDPPDVGCLEARDHPQGRRLAAPARAEQREELALADLERDVVDRCDAAEFLAHAGERDRDRSHGRV